MVHQPASPSIWPAVQSNPVWSFHKSKGHNVMRMSTLCKYDLRKCVLFVLSYLFRAANVLCAQYCVLPRATRCLETIDVCIWHMFIFMAV